ncbi:MAG: hypothetical protein IV105_23275 [Rhizobacter sp.]|nr:hypothetical protein [Rhizobacter sp.]
MRTIIVKQATDLESLAQRVTGNPNRVEAVAASIRRLNPHVVAGRVPAGTVLLLDDDPGLDRKATRAAAAPQAEDLVDELKVMIEETIAASLQGLGRRAQERKDVADALKAPAMKRVIEADPDLASRAASASADLKKEQVQDKQTEARLKELQVSALADIDALLQALG